jgi:hypothetical protein
MKNNFNNFGVLSSLGIESTLILYKFGGADLTNKSSNLLKYLSQINSNISSSVTALDENIL